MKEPPYVHVHEKTSLAVHRWDYLNVLSDGVERRSAGLQAE
jgi:hypothetical protein